MKRETDFYLGNTYLKYDRSQVMSYSYVYFIDQIVIVIPPGRPLTSFEKLLKPFDVNVWIVLTVALGIGFLVILSSDAAQGPFKTCGLEEEFEVQA